MSRSMRAGRARRRACVAWLVMLTLPGLAGCAQGSPGTVPAAVGCATPPQAGPGSPLPFNLVDVSAVRGTRQAWVLAGRYADPAKEGSFLLRVRGLSWTTAATFGRDIHLTGVAALSASAAWVWGTEGHADEWNTYRPYLALVSAGVVRPAGAGLPAGVFVGSIAGDAAGGTWLAGVARGRPGQASRQLMARWNGTSWSEVPVPAGPGVAVALSPAGPSDVWAVLGQGTVHPWLAHWDGTAWSRAYAPPASLATNGRVPQNMAAAASPGHAWVAYTEGGTNSGSSGRNPLPLAISAYFDGGTWRMVPVPASAGGGLAELAMAGGDAWAITASHNISGILYSRLGSAWCVQHLPHGRHLACLPTSISAASPGYAVAVTSFSSAPCRRSYAYIYDGHRWRTAEPHPAG